MVWLDNDMSTRNLTEILFDAQDGFAWDWEDTEKIKSYFRENRDSIANATTANPFAETFPCEWDEVLSEDQDAAPDPVSVIAMWWGSGE